MIGVNLVYAIDSVFIELDFIWTLLTILYLDLRHDDAKGSEKYMSRFAF